MPLRISPASPADGDDQITNEAGSSQQQGNSGQKTRAKTGKPGSMIGAIGTLRHGPGRPQRLTDPESHSAKGGTATSRRVANDRL
ncbi:hypothetical protein R1sor_015050 [Riccia sorocarpa]|uniref:Uncharacterized protein n=1 Tax=Riccia sorocarpa TaxID=122646 RepID=A0ABD3HCZ5_9MARC